MMQLRGNGETCGRVSKENNEQRRMGRDSCAPSRVPAYFKQMNLSFIGCALTLAVKIARARMCSISITRSRPLCSCPEKRVSYSSMSQIVRHCAPADFLHNVKSLYASCIIGKLSVCNTLQCSRG